MDIQKLYNFKNYIENNLLKYVSEDLLDNAYLNLGLIDTLPTFLVINGMRSTISSKTNQEIIDTFCSDYFIDSKLLSEEERTKINNYIDYFKKYLLQ
jgi:hypothetical protein